MVKAKPRAHAVLPRCIEPCWRCSDSLSVHCRPAMHSLHVTSAALTALQIREPGEPPAKEDTERL